ncbi:MAG TPA: signal protein [Desulfobulbaceae bacterium]|nr:signal protein [Desulfobulbaceae bacterium]
MPAKSLKTRFSLSIAAIYVILGMTMLAAMHQGTQNIIASLGTRFAIKQALLEKSKLMSQIQRNLSLSLKMADSPLIREWMKNEEDSELKKTTMEELESYRGSFESKSLFLAIAGSGHYYYSDGTAADYTRPRYTLNATNENDAWFYRVMAGVETFELNIDYDNHLDINRIWCNVVIRDDRGQKIGLGGTGVDITRFINQLIDIGEPGIETIMFSADGTLEGHKNREYIIHNSKVRGTEKKHTVFDLIDTPEDHPLVLRAMEKLATRASEVENFPLTVQGRKYLAAVAYMAEIRWYNLVLVDAEEVIGSRSFLPILAISIASLLLIVVIIILLLNRLVLTPLGVLAASAKRMARGDYDITVAARSDDEIGELTGSFNEMASMVKDHSENLEQKVVQRTEELRLANDKLAESNKQILDSLCYAQLIQASILPTADKVQPFLTEFFVLYQPRDIVGGDFYFFRALAEGGWLLAVIDCTGHGVPGAFMTMTANAVLANIIDSDETDDPAAILTILNQRFHDTFHRNSDKDGIDYGLDIGLCRYRPASDTLFFAGARIDLHYVMAGEAVTIGGQRKSIGYRRSDREVRFENRAVADARNKSFYLTSDGILDQAGGQQGWGFGRRRFGRLIGSIAGLRAMEQEAAIQQELARYQGTYPQRDDITVVGFRVHRDSVTNTRR